MSRGKQLLSSCLLLSLSATTPAFAQANSICEDLRGQYADTTELTGANAKAREVSRAIVQQNMMIRRLKSDMRNQGCTPDGSLTVLGDENEAICDDMHDAMQRMRDDLASLMDERELSVSRIDDAGVERRELLDEMQQNGCGTPASATPDTVIETRRTTEPPAPAQRQSLAQPESSITTIETPKPKADTAVQPKQAPDAPAAKVTQAEPKPVQPDRPYDPSARKVRQVGPQFLATDQDRLDLKHPKAAGPQPSQ